MRAGLGGIWLSIPMTHIIFALFLLKWELDFIDLLYSQLNATTFSNKEIVRNDGNMV